MRDSQREVSLDGCRPGVPDEDGTQHDGFDAERLDEEDADEPIMPEELRGEESTSFARFLRDHRRPLLLFLATGILVAFVLVVLPQIAGFGSTLHHLRQGNKSWLAIAVVFEVLSLAGYIAVLRTVFSCHGVRIGWSASYQITLAGVVATKLFAAAGAGGVALTAWALRASGLKARTVARRMAGFEILLYAVFMGSLVIFGAGLASGMLHGRAPVGVTTVPAIFGAAVIVAVLAFGFVPADIEGRVRALSGVSPRVRRTLQRLSNVPRTLREGLVTAFEVVRRPHFGLLGAIAYWGFDMATLWAAFHAFGARPVDDRSARLFTGQCVEPFRAVKLTLQFGNVAKIIERKGVVGIEQICFVEQPFRLLVVVLTNCLHAVTVQSLYGRELAPLGNVYLEVLRLCGLRSPSRHRCRDQSYEKPALTGHLLPVLESQKWHKLRLH